jgi:hypothetical protein
VKKLIKVGDTDVVFSDGIASWTSGMEIDADGSPRAYAPIGSGLKPLDDLRNAGSIGKWWGLSCGSGGAPYVQNKSMPAPGYYVSTTALQDTNFHPRDPRRFVDSETVPYIAIPRVLKTEGVKLGDLVLVEREGRKVAAIVADIGPAGHIGEGSIALCKALGIDPFRAKPKHYLAGISSGVKFKIFIGSASSPAWPRAEGIEVALELLTQRRALLS